MGKENQTTVAGQTVMELLEMYPEASSHAIARIAFRKYPELYKSAEDARDAVRYYRGALGKRHRESMIRGGSRGRYIEDPEKARRRQVNPFSLPASMETPYDPYMIPITKGRGIVIADLHIPYHNIASITAAMKFGRDRKAADFVLINGDLTDCYEMSRFEKDPRKCDFPSALRAVNQFLDSVEVFFPNAKIILKMGNHDERLELYLQRRAPELLDVPGFKWVDMLKARSRGMDVVDEARVVRAGSLNILHGHEFQQGQAVSVNPARTVKMRTLDCTLVAHHHRTSEDTEMTVRDRMVTSWSLGCLCELHPRYARINKWNWGFAELGIDGESFELNNLRIMKNGDVV